MSAEILRKAASLMRERATDANEAWGAERWTAGETGYDDRQGLTYDIHSGAALVATAGCEELSEHIASWHPAVALAVADWLDGVALLLESGERAPDEFAALGVARAYLNEGGDE